MNTQKNTEFQLLENFNFSPEQENYFQIMALKRIFRGEIDTILRNFSHSKTPLLEKFQEKYGKNSENISQKIAEILQKYDYNHLEKILQESQEI